MTKDSDLRVENYTLLITIGVLLVIGLIAITSVSSIISQEKFGTPLHFIIRHCLHLLVGLSLGYLAYKIDLNIIRKWSSFIFIANIILLSLVFIPGIGLSFGGAYRWINIGPFTAQPAEFLKLSFIIFFSAWISRIDSSRNLRKKKKKSIKDFQSGIICGFFFIASLFILYLQPDISSLAVLFSIALIIYFFSNAPIWHTLSIFGIGVVTMGAILKIAPHTINRIMVFLNPGLDPMGIGLQVKQAAIAIGSGGLFGLGFGMSRQKIGFLPEIMGDSIFAIFAEEAGFIGSFLLVALFIVFLFVGIRISKNCLNKFYSLMAIGITSWIIIQAFVNMGAMLGVLPLTGIAMPFISYGGSHLVSSLIAMGILFNISKNRNKTLTI